MADSRGRGTSCSPVGPDDFDPELLEVLIAVFNSGNQETSEAGLKLASAVVT